tara:strand:- start:404 stop:604 length:201 start_codon:yes stop_codon:yes gene_type:complete
MGFSDSDYAYNAQRAHSADIFFLKMRAFFWGLCAGLSGFLVGNIMGVFDINIMGFLFDTLLNGWGH